MIIRINLNKIAKYICILCTLPISLFVLLFMKGMQADSDSSFGVAAACFLSSALGLGAVITIFTCSLLPSYQVQVVKNINISEGIITKVEMHVTTNITMPWSQNKIVSYIRWQGDNEAKIRWINTELKKEVDGSSLEKAYQQYIKIIMAQNFINKIDNAALMESEK